MERDYILVKSLTLTRKNYDLSVYKCSLINFKRFNMDYQKNTKENIVFRTNVRKTGGGVGNLVSRKAFLGPGASFPLY